jgi:hypothetical protein
MGFSLDKSVQEKGAFLKSFSEIKDVLFVRAARRIAISEQETTLEVEDNGK